MFSFLRRDKPLMGDFTSMEVDMHAHWLPGLDDGAQNMEDSLLLIRELVRMGYRKLIATPHVMADLYPNTGEDIRSRLEEVREAAAAGGIKVELDAAAEYLLDEGFSQQLAQGKLLTLRAATSWWSFPLFLPPGTAMKCFSISKPRGINPSWRIPSGFGITTTSLRNTKIWLTGASSCKSISSRLRATTASPCGT